LCLIVVGVVKMYATVSDKDNYTGAGHHPTDSVLHIGSKLLRLLRPQVIRIKVVGAGAIRDEVDSVVNPRRLVVVVICLRELLNCAIAQRRQPDLPLRTTTVKTPIADAAHRFVSDPFAVR